MSDFGGAPRISSCSCFTDLGWTTLQVTVLVRPQPLNDFIRPLAAEFEFAWFDLNFGGYVLG